MVLPFITSLSLLKSIQVFSYLPISNLSISDLKLVKSSVLGNCDISMLVAFF